MACNMLSVDMITAKAVRLFKNSNLFIMNMDTQYDRLIVDAAPILQVGVKEMAVVTTAYVLAKNPVVSRRFWNIFK